MKIKTRTIIFLTLGALLAMMLFGYVLGRKKTDRASQRLIDAQNKEIIRYQAEINDKTVYIAEIEQEIKTLRQAKKDGDVTNEELRKLNLKQLNELTRLNLRIDTLLTHISHNGGIVIIHDTVTINNDKNAILLPFSFDKKDQWLNLKGNFDDDGKLSVALKMDMSVDVYSGISKDDNTPVIKLTTDNPYIKTLNLRSFKTDVPKVKRYGIGVQFGYGITKEVTLSPYIGVGVQYSIIRF